MKISQDQRGFVLSGVALLLVLPAMMLAASIFAVVEMGAEATALQASADKVFYTGKDIEDVVENMWNENTLFDNEANANAKFVELAENYRVATGLLVDITPNWMIWTHVVTTDENRYGGGEYCKVERIAPDNWRYYFEDSNDFDNDEPILSVNNTGENLQIILEKYGGVWFSDIYFSDNKLWSNVTIGSSSIGEDMVVGGTIQLIVYVYVRDPRGAAQYSSTVELG